MKETERACPVCLKTFPKEGHTLYCSDECTAAARRVLQLTCYSQRKNFQKKKFQALVDYSERNNIKKLVKKYMPKRKKEKVNENA